MNSLFWSRLHGGATHFPIALIVGATFFDTLGFFLRGSARQRDFAVIGYWLVMVGAVGSLGAVFSGLVLSKWTIGGSGLILRHHLFVWPAFALVIGLAIWRLLVGPNPSRQGLTAYLAVAVLASACLSVAGFFGGEMLLGR